MAKPVCARTKSGVARSTEVGADQAGDLPGVDLVAAGGEDEQGSAVSVEDQGVRDLGDLDAELLGGLDGGAGRAVELGDRAVGAELGQPGGDPGDAGMGGHAARLTALWKGLTQCPREGLL